MKHPMIKWLPPSSGFSDLEYEDIIGERRGQSDLRWAAQEWQSSGSFLASGKVPHEQVVRLVLQSQRVKQAIKKVADAEGKNVKQLQSNVEDILHTMGHDLDISAIRKFAFILPKIMKTIFDKVIVHRPSIERLRAVLKQRPVVLLPTHRSYADFLLVSYLTFHYSLPFPVIAAGMDFFHMAYIGKLFREAGAFYIKRSFMEDELYWSVFQEYVHILVCQEPAPMEFFLEGTRSRTGKSLRPKLGMLGCICQCCWRQHVDDVLLVPLNISYSRTLEEHLYAYEMLGVPKPKESTSGLFKAKRILSEQYGNIFVHVGSPVSARSLMDVPSIPRNPLLPHDISPLSPAEIGCVECASLHLVREQQRMAVVSTFSLATHFLLPALRVAPAGADSAVMVPYNLVLSGVRALLSAVTDDGPGPAGWTMWEGRGLAASLDSILRASLSIHSDVIRVDERDALHLLPCARPQGTAPAGEVPATATGGTAVLQQHNITYPAVQHLLLQHYANQSMHLLVRPALLLLAVQVQARADRGTDGSAPCDGRVEGRHSTGGTHGLVSDRHEGVVDQQKDDAWQMEGDGREQLVEACGQPQTLSEDAVKSRFFKLRSFFSQEFIFAKDTEEEDYAEAVARVSVCRAVVRDGAALHVRSPSNSAILHVYATCITPFLLTHTTAITTAVEQEWGSEAALVARVQQAVLEAVRATTQRETVYSALCLDSIRNAVRALTKCGGLRTVRSNGNDGPCRLVPCLETLGVLLELVTGAPAACGDGALRARL